jgi:hypothetical protein
MGRAKNTNETLMPTEINPYESPKSPSPPHVIPPGDIGFGAMTLIFLAICLGIASLIPWLGVLFLVLSAPVFIRYSRRETIRCAGHNPRHAKHAASILGKVGLILSILLATAGAFWGTCHTSGFVAMFAMEALKAKGGGGPELYASILTCVGLGITVGTLCGGWTFYQLRKLLRDPVVEREEISNRRD